METREEEEQKNEELLVNLLETKQYTKFRQTCADMQAADIAAVMDDLEDEDSLKMFRILPKSMAADVFAQNFSRSMISSILSVLCPTRSPRTLSII